MQPDDRPAELPAELPAVRPRRKWLRRLAVAGALAAALLLFERFDPRHPRSVEAIKASTRLSEKEKLLRLAEFLKPGMTRAQVRQIMGEPDYTTVAWPSEALGETIWWWDLKKPRATGDVHIAEYCLAANFDAGSTGTMTWASARPRPPTLQARIWQKFLRLLGREKRGVTDSGSDDIVVEFY